MRSPGASSRTRSRPISSRATYYGGIDAGVDQMISIVDGEPLPEPDRSWSPPSGGLDWLSSRWCWPCRRHHSAPVVRPHWSVRSPPVASAGFVAYVHHACDLPIAAGGGGARIFPRACCSAASAGQAAGRPVDAAGGAGGWGAAGVVAASAVVWAAEADSVVAAAVSVAAAHREAGDMNFKRRLATWFTTDLRQASHVSHACAHAIEQQIRESEKQHGGEMRFAIETALDGPALWHDVAPPANMPRCIRTTRACGIPSATMVS